MGIAVGSETRKLNYLQQKEDDAGKDLHDTRPHGKVENVTKGGDDKQQIFLVNG